MIRSTCDTFRTLWLAILVLVAASALWAGAAMAAAIDPFVGSYLGSAEVTRTDGTTEPRDMSVEIEANRDGFSVTWASTTYRNDGRVTTKSYTINFVPSDRDGVFSAAMTRNVFGHQVQLNPMKGEPYVWARIDGDTLTVFSLFVDDSGGYEMQQYDRTLVDGGLHLDFKRIRNAQPLASVETFLERQ